VAVREVDFLRRLGFFAHQTPFDAWSRFNPLVDGIRDQTSIQHCTVQQNS
jgi:hypothetical protein